VEKKKSRFTRNAPPAVAPTTESNLTESPTLLFMSRIARRYSRERRSRSVWKMTPTAYALIRMSPIGPHHYVGDTIENPTVGLKILGIRVEVVAADGRNDCRLALAETNSDYVNWHTFFPFRGEGIVYASESGLFVDYGIYKRLSRGK
jgi:hypothetical protein